jgi:hypothetical protein
MEGLSKMADALGQPAEAGEWMERGYSGSIDDREDVG